MNKTSATRNDRIESMPSSTAAATPTTPSAPWHVEVGDLLAQAALLCSRNGVDMDTFMKGAWSAYVESRPGLRDEIEEMQLRSQLAELRKSGKLAVA